ncbi:MAG: c-type cytochrome [Phycisphaerales bacterium]|jgi:mono/diheme cytochrome c family protein|nr:cytochrome c [Phycisphaeraceae bacterium]
MTPTFTKLSKALALGLCVAGVGVLPACRGDRSDKPPRQFFPDMDDSPKFKPQTATQFFSDGRAMRPAVQGTVAFGRSSDLGVEGHTEFVSEDRANLLREDSAFYRGVDAQGKWVRKIPASMPVTNETLKRGAERFNIYCAACHNYDGKGGGTVGKAWSYPLPNFHDPKYIVGDANTAMDGYIFDVIRNGILNPGNATVPYKMPPYAHAINERDAWSIVAYIRVLQQSELVKVDDPSIPENERARLRDTIQALRRQGAANPASTQPSPAATPGASEKK